MIKLKMIIATSRSKIPEQFNEFSAEHPKMDIVHTQFVVAKDYDYTLLVFYTEPDKETEDFMDKIKKEMDEMKERFDHFFDDDFKGDIDSTTSSDLSKKIMEDLDRMSGVTKK